MLPSLLLVACSSAPIVSSLDSENKTVFMTVHHSILHISLPASYHWSSRFLHQPMQSSVQDLLKQSIEQEMQRKGYRLVGEQQPADLTISFTLAFNSVLNDKDIQRLYGLAPSLLNGEMGHHRYEKGTVIFDVLNTKTQQLAWRTAGKNLTAIIDLPSAEKQERINYFVKKLLAFLPEKE